MNRQTKVRARRWFGFLMAALLVVNLVPGAVFAEGDTPPPSTVQIVQDGAKQTVENGLVTLQETVAGTDTENKFNVTFTVTTKGMEESVSESPNKAVVLILDGSNSMDDHWSDVKTASKEFLTAFSSNLAAGTQRKLAIVRFGTYAYSEKIDGSYWYDTADGASPADTAITNIKQPNRGKNGDGSSNTYGGTNIAAALQLAANLISNGKTSGEFANITDISIILLSDGKPTFRLVGSPSNYTDLDQIPNNSNGYEGEGNADSGGFNHNQAQSVLTGIRNTTFHDPAIQAYGIEYINDVAFFNTGFTKVYKAGNINDLIGAFKAIVNEITRSATGLTVTAPLGEYISLVDANGLPDGVTYSGNTLTWQLSNPVTAEDGSLVYTTTVPIRLDNYKADFVFSPKPGETGTITPYPVTANGTGTAGTYLTYKIRVNDVPGDDKTANFDVPTVKGFAGGLDFDKVNENGDALPGAKFTLTLKDGNIVLWERTLPQAGSNPTSDFTFSDIPSGYSYTLKESDAPEGYQANTATQSVTVSWGNTSHEGNLIANGKVVNNPITYTVTYAYSGPTPGGAAAPTDSNSPYDSGDTVTVLADTNNIANWTFNGWKIDGVDYAVGATFVITKNTNLIGTWTYTEPNPITYKVTYAYSGSTPGGAAAPTDSGEYTSGSTVTVKSAGSFANWTFNGWKIDGEGNVLGATFTITEDTHLIGTWTYAPPPITRYSVQVRYLEDGTNAVLSPSVSAGMTFINGESYNVAALASLAIDGYSIVRTDGAVTGTISGSNVVITVYYKKVAETTTAPPATETTPPETEDITDTTPPLDPPETTTPPETDPPATTTDDKDSGGVIIVDPEIPTDLPETGVSGNHLGNVLISLAIGLLITLAAVLDLRRKAR